MSDKKINYAYKKAGPFKTTFSCTAEIVEEEFFAVCMKEPQIMRPVCEVFGGKAICEQCDHFGRKAEFYSEWDDKVITLDNALGKELAE